MRRIVMVAAAAVAASMVVLTPVQASPALMADVTAIPPAEPFNVQYWDPRPYDGGWKRRQQWREWRREQDEARIAEAARREAWRIEQEREQRRAWRQYHGYGPRYDRGW